MYEWLLLIPELLNKVLLSWVNPFAYVAVSILHFFSTITVFYPTLDFFTNTPSRNHAMSLPFVVYST